MTLKQIEFYEAVCQAGNVTAAAQQLYVSRSVISRAIQELEDELDIQLFVRGRNGMELTEYGKTLRNLLSQFKGFYSALLAQISSLKETGENHSLTVGLAISCWNVFPLEIYEALKKKHPHIKLSVLEMQLQEAQDSIFISASSPRKQQKNSCPVCRKWILIQWNPLISIQQQTYFALH